MQTGTGEYVNNDSYIVGYAMRKHFDQTARLSAAAVMEPDCDLVSSCHSLVLLSQQTV